MRIGKLQYRLTFKRPPGANEVQRDESGQVVNTPITVKTVWGAIEPLNGRELTQARQRQSTMTHRIMIRFDSQLRPTPDWFFTARGRTFNIESVRNIQERDSELEISAIEQTTGAT